MLGRRGHIGRGRVRGTRLIVVGLLAVGFSLAGLSLSPEESAAKAKPSSLVSLRVSHSGLRFSASIKYAAEAACGLSVGAREESYGFSPLRLARAGHARVRWRASTRAPSGSWTVLAECTLKKRTTRAKARVRVRTGAGAAGDGALVIADTTRLSGAAVATAADIAAAAGTPTEQAAVNWAVHELQSDPSGFYYLCLPFVQDAYSAGGFSVAGHTTGVQWGENTYPDDLWNHTVGGTTGGPGTTPPVGALVFYSAGPGGDSGSEPSHVEIYVGNDEDISTADYYDDDTKLIHYEPYGDHPRELGWWLPDGSGPGNGSGSIPTGSIPTGSRPAAIVNTADTNMNVFYSYGEGDLVNEYWTNTSGWARQVLVTGGVAGNPAAIQNSSTNMNVFYRSTGGGLVNLYWTNTGGWVQQTLVPGGVAGDPAAIVNSSDTDMNVFYVSTSGGLVNEYWTPSGGWVQQTLVTSGVAGDPAAIQNSSTNMNVFYRSTGGGLVNLYWTNTGGWVQQTLVPGGVAGDPAAIVNSSDTNMNVFYGNTAGALVNEYWINTSGWAQQTLS
jgi:hypothetical protein